MAIKIKGGRTTVTGNGRANIGPLIPMNGLVLYVDPATLLNSTNSGSLVARSPLTSSTFTVTQSNSLTAGDVLALTGNSRIQTAIGLKPYPTGALTPVFYGDAPNYMSTANDNRIAGLYFTRNALSLLKEHVKKEMTIVVWWSGVKMSAAYPTLGTTSGGSDSSFAMALNNWPPYGDPANWVTNPASLSATAVIFPGQRHTVAAGSFRQYNERFTNPPFIRTGSIINDQFTSSSTGIGNFGTTSSAPTYTSASAAWPNIPYWYRDIDNNFAGRVIYNTDDYWNCTAFTIDRSTNTNATTQSIHMNGALYGTTQGATSSFTAGAVNQGGVNSIINYNLQNTTASFVLQTTATAANLMYFTPQNPPGADTYNSAEGIYTFYFQSASNTFDSATRDNLVAKINSTATASLYVSASAVSSTGIALTGSLPGILNGAGLFFTSSVVPSQSLFVMGGGSQPGGTGPLLDIFQISSTNNNWNNALSIGIQNTSNLASSFQRLGTIGAIGGVYIYNRILTQAELAQIYNTQKSKYGNVRPSGVPVRPFRVVNPYENGVETPPASSGIIY